MSISYYEFKNLPDHLQHKLVIAEGKVINVTYRDQLKYVLYELSNFSVEIVYNSFNDRIESLSAFQNKRNQSQ